MHEGAWRRFDQLLQPARARCQLLAAESANYVITARCSWSLCSQILRIAAIVMLNTSYTTNLLLLKWQAVACVWFAGLAVLKD